jgi:hypothetical protein
VDRKHKQILESLYALSAPRSSPWKRPFLRLVSRTELVEGGKGTAHPVYAVTFHVYVNRLLFEMIADKGIQTVRGEARGWSRGGVAFHQHVCGVWAWRV